MPSSLKKSHDAIKIILMSMQIIRPYGNHEVEIAYFCKADRSQIHISRSLPNVIQYTVYLKSRSISTRTYIEKQPRTKKDLKTHYNLKRT